MRARGRDDILHCRGEVPSRMGEAKGLTYAAAGVDERRAEKAVEAVRKAAERTYDENVLSGIGPFAAVYKLPSGERLVAACDGVGTKMLLARKHGALRSVGIDVVAMCANDVASVGGRPVLFLDYVAMERLSPEEIAEVAEGMAEGCRGAGCALVGGETAEMPGFYRPEAMELVGFCVGLLRADPPLGPERVEEGDVLLALPSSGPHSNGFSLIRRVLERAPELERRMDEILKPTRIYVRQVLALFEAGLVHAAAHVTGGGIPGNPVRVIPDGLRAVVRKDAWQVPDLFREIQRLGGVEEGEMFRVFNMGLGMVLVVPRGAVERAVEALRGMGEEPVVVGEVVRGERGVEFT